MHQPTPSENAARAASESVRAWADVWSAWSLAMGSVAVGSVGTGHSSTTDDVVITEPADHIAAYWIANQRAMQASADALARVNELAWAFNPLGFASLFAAPALSSQAPAAAQASRQESAAHELATVDRRGLPSLAKPLGRSDDLTRIKGVGRRLSALLNEFGLFHFWQIASLDARDIAVMDTRLNLKGRIVRDGWVLQATLLANDIHA